jgi:hypothetical protein
LDANLERFFVIEEYHYQDTIQQDQSMTGALASMKELQRGNTAALGALERATALSRCWPCWNHSPI